MHSSAARARGETKVSVMASVKAPLRLAVWRPSTVWRSPRRKLMPITRSLRPTFCTTRLTRPAVVADHTGSPITVRFTRGGAPESVPTQQQYLRSPMQPLRQRTNLVGVQAVAECMQVFQVAMQSGSNQSCRARGLPLRSLHGVERSCVGHGHLVQVPLEVIVSLEPQALHYSDGGSRIGTQPDSQRAHAEQNVRPRVLQHWADDLLAFGVQMFQFV